MPKIRNNGKTVEDPTKMFISYFDLDFDILLRNWRLIMIAMAGIGYACQVPAINSQFPGSFGLWLQQICSSQDQFGQSANLDGICSVVKAWGYDETVN